jgi:hypothetical protein
MQWVRLESLLPKGMKPGRPPRWSRWQLIDGIRFRIWTDVPWRDMPERYGPWARSYDLFRRWRRDGTWQRIFSELQARPMPRISSPGTSTSIPPYAWHTSTLPGRGKGGPAEGATRRDHRRAERPQPWTLARRSDHQAPSGRRAGPEADGRRDHGRTARCLPAVRTCIERVLTDNAWPYRKSFAWRQALADLGAAGKLTRIYRPQTNGKVERFNRTLLDEWAYLRAYTSNTERTDALADFLHTYNHHRCHTALGGKPPISCVNNAAGQYT